MKSFGLSMESVIELLMAELQAMFTTVDQEEVVAEKTSITSVSYCNHGIGFMGDLLRHL